MSAPSYLKTTQGELKYVRWNDVELENLNPFFDRQMVVGEGMMLARVLLRRVVMCPSTVVTTADHLHPGRRAEVRD